MAEEHTPLTVALSQLKLACKKLELDAGMHKMLSQPKRSISVSIDIRMDNGTVGVFNGFECNIGTREDHSKAESATTQTLP